MAGSYVHPCILYTYLYTRTRETTRERDVPFAGDAHSRREMPRLLTMSPDLSSSHLAGRGNRRGLGISKRVNICGLAPRRKMDDRYYISKGIDRVQFRISYCLQYSVEIRKNLRNTKLINLLRRII